MIKINFILNYKEIYTQLKQKLNKYSNEKVNL